MSNHYSNTWELDSFFSGGSASPLLTQALTALKKGIERLEQDFTASLPATIISLQDLDARCHELESLTACFLSQNVNDERAVQLQEWIVAIRAAYENQSSRLDEQLALLSDGDFNQLIENPDLQPVAFSLQERRSWFHQLLPLPQEQLIQRLWINGYQGWNDLYGTLMGQFLIPLSDQAHARRLSVGQAENLLSHPDREIRQSVFKEWEKTWDANENTFAQILNHLAGFRLQLYTARGWTSVLKEPLFCNRMQEETLECMWKTINGHKKIFQAYLNKKAQALNLPRLSWFDIGSPLPEQASSLIPFDEAAEIIIQSFSSYSLNMGAFAQKAFQNKWIEAEDREDKRPGGFCAHFPFSKQSRIFMTYNGTMTSLFTLAHELGHAYHNSVIDDLPRFAQQYRMNVAETASTLAETIVIDYMIEKASDNKFKKSLLDFKVQRAIIFLMNIHARFLFETRFYEERKKGFVLSGTLNHLMEEAQQEAFCHALADWHPHFWAAKQHFYATGVPFYNFPYTFGYLFSMGIYAHLQQKEPQAYQDYEALLADTGRMAVEDLARRHLGVDLTEQAFWEKALKSIEKDVEDLLEIM